MAKSGIRSVGGEQFYYGEGTGGESVALGVNSGTGDMRLVVKPTPNATPSDTALIEIESALNGNINLTPNGSGNVVISSAVVQGGTIDNTAIGATTPSTGDFSALSINGVPVTPGGVPIVEFCSILETSETNVTGDSLTWSIDGLTDNATLTGVTNTGQFNPATGVFTCDQDGLYMFGVNVTFTNIAAAGFAQLRIESSAGAAYTYYAPVINSTSALSTISATFIIRLTALQAVNSFLFNVFNQGGDTITVFGSNTAVHTNIWGKLITL